jgi:hypothetical protein
MYNYVLSREIGGKLKAPPTDTEYVEKIDKNLAIQSGEGK